MIYRPTHITDHNHPRTFSRPDRLNDPLYVVTPVFNAPRFRSRWRLYEDFKQMCANAGAILYTIEIAFGDRDFAVTQADDPHDIQLRTWHEIWLKEQAINLAVQRLPRDWKKVAWIDADVFFARYDWADETRHKLEHFPVVQMWSQLHDLNANHELVGQNRSFADVWACGDTADKCQAHFPYHSKRGYPGAPGLAWAMRREAWNQLGGLLDVCILGAGDWYMAHALTGQVEKILPRRMHRNLKHHLRQWEHRAANSLWEERPILGNLGVVPGVALHYWHGPKANRGYKTREDILYRNSFDPDCDLKKDWQGLYQITSRCPVLRRDIQRYFAARNEDQ